jgi:hypothetical protein
MIDQPRYTHSMTSTSVENKSPPTNTVCSQSPAEKEKSNKSNELINDNLSIDDVLVATVLPQTDHNSPTKSPIPNDQ